tara:strand:- start:136 stop:882 length:747 start_codon:yes stop_codon:yes gene_type:complete
MPFISVIIPYYKKKNFIEDTLKSIINQTYQNFEVIIVDDELSLESKQVLQKVLKLDKRIKIILNNKNIGAGLSRNKGIEISNGDYICFCDSDDLWKHTKLEKQLEFMKNSNLAFSFTSYEIINLENKKIKKNRIAKNKLNFNDLINSCDIGLSTVMIQKKVFKNKDLRFASLKTKEDYMLWLKIAKLGYKLYGLDEILVSWKKTNNSLSSSVYQKLKDGFKIYNEYLGYNKLKSIFLLLVLSINFLLK